MHRGQARLLLLAGGLGAWLSASWPWWAPQGAFLLHGDDERLGWRADGPAYTPEETDRYIEVWSQPGAATGMINYYRSSVRTPPKRAEAARILGRRVTPPVAVRPSGCRVGRRGSRRGSGVSMAQFAVDRRFQQRVQADTRWPGVG